MYLKSLTVVIYITGQIIKTKAENNRIRIFFYNLSQALYRVIGSSISKSTNL